MTSENTWARVETQLHVILGWALTLAAPAAPVSSSIKRIIFNHFSMARAPREESTAAPLTLWGEHRPSPAGSVQGLRGSSSSPGVAWEPGELGPAPQHASHRFPASQHRAQSSGSAGFWGAPKLRRSRCCDAHEGPLYRANPSPPGTRDASRRAEGRGAARTLTGRPASGPRAGNKAPAPLRRGAADLPREDSAEHAPSHAPQRRPPPAPRRRESPCRAARGMRGGQQAPPPRRAGAEAAGTSKPRRKPPLPAARRRPLLPRARAARRPQEAGGGPGAPGVRPRARTPYSGPGQLAKVSLPGAGGGGEGRGGGRLERRRGRGHDPLARAGGRAGAGCRRPSPAGGPGARAPRINRRADGRAGGAGGEEATGRARLWPAPTPRPFVVRRRRRR